MFTHCSELKKENFSKSGHEYFNHCVFFSFGTTEYSLNKGTCVYRLYKEESEFISRNMLEIDDQAFEDINMWFECDKETAESLLDESLNPFDTNCDDASELSWRLQAIAAETARRAGYFGTIEEDESGTIVVADMKDRLELLELTKDYS